MDWIVGKTWKNANKGLYKIILALDFQEVIKPTILSVCRVKITKVINLEDRPSVYMRQINEFDLQMGTAITPLDYYIEIFLENMFAGETSHCQVKTKSGESIHFEMTLLSTSPTKYLFQLDVLEMYKLAQKYRAQGVEMFKEFPKFANEYFCRAAKLLISFKPFDVLTKETDGVDGADLEALLKILQSNIAACLLKEQRYEDVLYLTEFIESMSSEEIQHLEKALYRRAFALYNLKSYHQALETLTKIENFQEKKEFMALYTRTKQNWKRDEDHYKSIVQKMFN